MNVEANTPGPQVTLSAGVVAGKVAAIDDPAGDERASWDGIR